RAFDADLRSRQELGKSAWDRDGRFEITYRAEDFARSEKGSADLTFRIKNQAGLPIENFKLFAYQDGKKVLVEDPRIVFNAPPVATVEIVIGDGEGRGPSEFEQLVAELTPLLQGLSIGDLTEDNRNQDVSFLSNDTSRDPVLITFLILAHRWSKDTGV